MTKMRHISTTTHSGTELLTAIFFPLVLFATIASAKSYQCPDHEYKVMLFSQDPLVVYISNFLTAEEADYLERTT
jgi:prolyl 4-hydroxylase